MEAVKMFEFDGHKISATLFGNRFPFSPNRQVILMKGKKPKAIKEKLIFALIGNEKDDGISVLDEVVIPLLKDSPDTIRRNSIIIQSRELKRHPSSYRTLQSCQSRLRSLI